jgi:hypothetical protein
MRVGRIIFGPPLVAANDRGSAVAEKVYLQWTLENWITVVLMAFAGVAIIGLIASGVRHYSGTANVPSASGT